VPVIASDSGEIPDVLADAGAVVGEGDEQAWTRTLRDVLDDTVARASVSPRAADGR
jgi:glycosyltransferase involved in cell wall biosynthesis